MAKRKATGSAGRSYRDEVAIAVLRELVRARVKLDHVGIADWAYGLAEAMEARRAGVDKRGTGGGG